MNTVCYLMLVGLLLAQCNHSRAALYAPPQPFTFATWVGANDSSWFQYPEVALAGNHRIPALLQRPNLGVSISGGGLRAATLGLGYLRALHQLNITARYLSGNSGSVWLTIPYSFQEKVPVKTFLGTTLLPEQLTLQQLQQQPPEGSFEAVVARANFTSRAAKGAAQKLIKRLRDKEGYLLEQLLKPKINVWSAAIGEAFLEPYELNGDASTWTAAGTAGSVHQALAGLPAEVAVYSYKPGGAAAAGSSSDPRPFPIFLASVMRENATIRYYPYEFTPLYAGCAATFTDTTPILGGGFVDPLGINTNLPNPKAQVPVKIQQALSKPAGSSASAAAAMAAVNATAAAARSQRLMQLQPLIVQAQSEHLVPLKQVAGMSSSALANARQMVGLKDPYTLAATTETLRYWNQVDISGGEKLPFGDGAGADNTAITPLLRRRVPKIIAIVAAIKSVMDMTVEQWAGNQWETSGLFGVCPSGHGRNFERFAESHEAVDVFNKRNKVFPSEGFQELYAALKRSLAAGGPAHHLATYTVLENQFEGIAGGWQVQILWVVTQPQRTWEERLPGNVAAIIRAARRLNPPTDNSKIMGGIQTAGEMILSLLSNIVSKAGEGTWLGEQDVLGLAKFPFVPTFNANFSPLLTQLLTQQASWQMLELAPQLQQLLLA
ncbi:hypothetical protein COO60DRAFT_1697550 [Scenedesmus sp. NREL 46B-D3]|nr:hypothetical protein COO60DRAFT_1697550 [Scenedesmus sp. NREL 46B-D3]